MPGRNGWVVIVADLMNDNTTFVPIASIATSLPHVLGQRYADLIQRLPEMYYHIRECHSVADEHDRLKCMECQILELGKILEEAK